VDARPIYPETALAAGIEGSPSMEFTIDLNGDVVDPRIVRHVSLLDQAALDAVRQWKFIPSSVDGRLHPIRVTLTFDFKLRK
jgi:protein TonB